MSPFSWSSLPSPAPSDPSRVSQSSGFELPASYSNFPLALYCPCRLALWAGLRSCNRTLRAFSSVLPTRVLIPPLMVLGRETQAPGTSQKPCVPSVPQRISQKSLLLSPATWQVTTAWIRCFGTVTTRGWGCVGTAGVVHVAVLSSRMSLPSIGIGREAGHNNIKSFPISSLSK